MVPFLVFFIFLSNLKIWSNLTEIAQFGHSDDKFKKMQKFIPRIDADM
jgi:hypothetical protein